MDRFGNYLIEQELAAPIEAIVARLMAKEPGARFGSAAQLVIALDAWSPHATPSAGREASATGLWLEDIARFCERYRK